MNPAQERERFEAWYEADAMPCEGDWFRRETDDPDDYYHAMTGTAFRAWQEATKQARAALDAAPPQEEKDWPDVWIDIGRGDETAILHDSSLSPTPGYARYSIVTERPADNELQQAIERVREVMPEYQFSSGEKWAFDLILAAADFALVSVAKPWNTRNEFAGQLDQCAHAFALGYLDAAKVPELLRRAAQELREPPQAALDAAPNDALVALRECRDWLADDRLNGWLYMESSDFYRDKAAMIAKLDAVLAQSQPAEGKT